MTGEQDCEDLDDGDCEEHGVYVQEHVNYRLKVHIRNDGPGTATNVRAQIRTPEEFEVERVSPDVCDHSRYCEIGTLEAGQDAVITLRGEYADPAEANNWVFVASDALDPDHDNNEARQRGEVEEPEEDGGGAGGCFGREPTIRGTEDPDLLDGTDGDDVIATFGDPDFVDAENGGADRICSGAGNDAVFVSDGENDDFVDCGPGDEDGVVADPGDFIVNCENVSIPSSRGSGAVGDN